MASAWRTIPPDPGFAEASRSHDAGSCGSNSRCGKLLVKVALDVRMCACVSEKGHPPNSTQKAQSYVQPAASWVRKPESVQSQRNPKVNLQVSRHAIQCGMSCAPLAIWPKHRIRRGWACRAWATFLRSQGRAGSVVATSWLDTPMVSDDGTA